MVPTNPVAANSELDFDLPEVPSYLALPPELPEPALLAPSRPPRTDEVDCISPGATSPRPAPPPKPASPRREKSPSKSVSLDLASAPPQKGKSKSAPSSPTGKRNEVPAKAEKKREPPSPRKRKGLFRGLSTHNMSDSSLSRSKNKKRGKTTTDLGSLVNSDGVIEVVLKSDWEHTNAKSELGQKLQKELVKLDSEKAVLKATTQTLSTQNARLKTWKAVLEESARTDAARAAELEQKIADMQREIRTYERLCRDLESQTKSVKASVQQGVNFLKPYTLNMLTQSSGPTSPRNHTSPRSPR
eukprot:TRINITY_DN16105_c0_g1_i1.p1 TRINITY_DN16105_c0_g1~~TRINITY_DN16105_c0_g1_i1.p1  ORF type:complete len:325 (-),score=58.22 TRINITY_DN16105_c0_g1_i1:96-998(-)